MKKRILSLVLCAAMLLSMCLFLGAGVMDDTTADGSAESTESYIPAVNFTNVAPFVQANAQAANGPARAPMRASANDGSATPTDPSRKTSDAVVTSKTATANADGTYTITLEAYATGSKVISEIQKDIPTDIVLVLDQSGSMDDRMGTVSFKEYSAKDSTNTKNYDRRHNGGSANLWHKLTDGSYVSVYVAKTQVYNVLSTSLKNYTSNWAGTTTSDCYYYYKDNLYEKVGNEYKPVALSSDWSYGSREYTYTYTFSDGTQVTSSGNDSKPNLGSHAPLYTAVADGNNTVYTYTYTDANGVTQTIGTSTGASAKCKFTFYQRSVNSSGGEKRLDALKNAVTTFAEAVKEKAVGKDGLPGTNDDINHRIAVVGFASGARGNDSYPSYLNTELFIGANQYNYNVDASDHYGSAFQDMNTQAGYDNVVASKDALSAGGATHVDLGIEMANSIFKENAIQAGQKRNRVMIVFTDGAPSSWSDYDNTVANDAIDNAKITKADAPTGYGATVYSVGIFSGADATSAGDSNGNDTQKANWFMQNLSSNNGVAQNPSYYLSAADADTLKNIFKQISDQIETGGSSTTLSSEAVVKDIISQQFCLPAGTTAEQIRLQTYACTGKTGDTYQWSTTNNGNMGATASILSDGQVSVTGFDFADNWCGVETQTDGTEVPRGHKLVISFEVVPKDGFLGGNDVFTNANAAIYANSTSQLPVATFERPQVNVPIQSVTVTAAEQNVYLLGDLTADQLKAGATASVGGVSLNLNADNYGLEAWQTEYVDITVSVTDENGNVITNLSDLKDDVTYSVAVTVAPKTASTAADAATEQTGNSTASVNVFKPELTFKDSEVYYGEAVPTSYTSNLESTVWKHGDTEAPTSMGTAPTLTLTYTPEADKIANDKINTRQDVGVDVTVKIDETDVTDKASFVHTNCEETTCKVPDGCEFVLHVKTCSLTISKTVTSDGANPNANQTFVFDVKDSGGNVVTTIVLKDGEQKTITGLAVGDYTVVEDTGWSWSYTPDKGGKAEVTLDKDNGYDCEAKITNTAKENHWLTSIADVINKWLSAGEVQQFPGKN